MTYNTFLCLRCSLGLVTYIMTCNILGIMSVIEVHVPNVSSFFALPQQLLDNLLLLRLLQLFFMLFFSYFFVFTLFLCWQNFIGLHEFQCPLVTPEVTFFYAHYMCWWSIAPVCYCFFLPQLVLLICFLHSYWISHLQRRTFMSLFCCVDLSVSLSFGLSVVEHLRCVAT